MAAFVTRLQPMMVAHPSRSSATGAIDNSPGGSYRHWPHTHTGRTSFDHLVGARAERRWKFETKRLRSLQVDHQLELDRLYHREVRRLLAIENPGRIDADPAIGFGKAHAVTHQPASHRKFAKVVDCR